MIQVHREVSQLPSFKNAVVTIGTFDGVHLGHQQIIRQLKAEAELIGGETVIITFHPHPRKIVGGPATVKILNTLEEKVELLNAHGIQHLVVIPFNEVFASQPAHDYVKNFLVEKFAPHTIIIGYDHRFGYNRQGDYHLLEELGEKYNYHVKEIPEQVLNEVIVSSTKIREAITNCDVQTANTYLGYDYFFEGTVVEGNKLGTSLGYPTANLKIENAEKLIPGNGVYAVQVQINGAVQGHQTTYKGMMNIGVRPTVDGTNHAVEVNIFDFDGQLYGQTLRVTVKKHLRGEIKFGSIDELQSQLALDKNQSLKTLEN